MCCDIHSSCYDINFQKIDYAPFDWRSYDLFSFFAGVRNYSDIIPISAPRGYHEEIGSDDDISDRHSASWLYLNELVDYSGYETIVKDSRENDREMTLREFLGEGFFEELDKLKNLDVYLICFDFDN
jgi:hypothetical protein